jgi:hypothetical protein
MRRLRYIALALLAVAATQFGTAGASRASGHQAGPPDGYVSQWDGIGSEAFTASGLTAAEGHVISAYQAIAVYDSVMAVEGGYRSAIDDGIEIGRRTVRQVLSRHFQRSR